MALCAGMSSNVAVAKDSTSVKAGFTLVENFDTAPTDVVLHPGSVMPQTETNVDAIVFHAKQMSKKGKLLINCVTKVERDWIEKMSSNVTIRKMLRSMERVQFEIPLPKMKTKVIREAVQANIKNVQHEYPKAVIKQYFQEPSKGKGKGKGKGGTSQPTDITGKLCISCLKDEHAGIERRVRQCINAAQPVTAPISVDAGVCMASGKQRCKYTFVVTAT